MYAFVMPAGQVFSVEGQAIFPLKWQDIWQCLSLINSSPFQVAVNAICGQHKYHGYINSVHVAIERLPDCGVKAQEAHKVLQSVDSANESSLLFVVPLALQLPLELGLQVYLNIRIEQRCTDLEYVSQLHIQINRSVAHSLSAPDELSHIGTSVDYIGNLFGQVGHIADECHNLIAWLLGVSFARWDIRYATGAKPIPELPDPFAPLPACPPGMLQNEKGLPAAPEDIPADYPLRLTWGGILVDDEGHAEDVVGRVREALAVIWSERAGDIEQEACDILGVKTLREYFRAPAKFFAEHLKRYSKSRRQAPIYWPLGTPSGSYTLWLYYHRLSDQTLYTAVNDFVEPKIRQVEQQVAALRARSGRSKAEEKELESLLSLDQELRGLRDELLRVAAFWKPNLNDGVVITAAPLWRLFQHKPWQKTLKETWQQLEKGAYDWAHLAYSIWPERVVQAARKDRSIAIAHDLEDTLWLKTVDGKGKEKWVAKELSADH